MRAIACVDNGPDRGENCSSWRAEGHEGRRIDMDNSNAANDLESTVLLKRARRMAGSLKRPAPPLSDHPESALLRLTCCIIRTGSASAARGTIPRSGESGRGPR